MGSADVSFYRSFDMDTHAIRASSAIPEQPNSKLAGIAQGLSPITQSLAMLADACEGLPITTDELSTALGDDIANLEAGELSQEQLRTFAVAVVERHQRETGKAPTTWTEAALCVLCGPVWLWPEPARTNTALACPWCENRLAGFIKSDNGFLIEARPIPRPSKVRCCDCRHWTADAIGDGGGIGICVHGGPMWTDRPAYPNVQRWCSVFQSGWDNGASP